MDKPVDADLDEEILLSSKSSSSELEMSYSNDKRGISQIVEAVGLFQEVKTGRKKTV
jgi:hypothetical protein